MARAANPKIRFQDFERIVFLTGAGLSARKAVFRPTSAVVHPAAELPRIALRRGAVSVEINLEDTPVTPLYMHRLRGLASEMLAAMRQ